MEEETAKKKKPLETILRQEMPTIFIDAFSLSERNDDIFVLSGIQILPKKIYTEQSRIMFSKRTAEKLLNVLASCLDYTVTKTKEAPKNDK